MKTLSMTRTEYYNRVKTARKYGQADMGHGCKLIFHGGGYYWEAVDKYGNTIETAHMPEKLGYLFIW